MTSPSMPFPNPADGYRLAARGMDASLPPGAMLKAHGLQVAQELNGLVGLLSVDPKENLRAQIKGRFAVYFDGCGCKLVRPANLND